MFVPEVFIWVVCGFGCYGLLCLFEEFLCWLREKDRQVTPVRLLLLFHDNEQSVEWFVRRLHRALRMEGQAKFKEVFLVDVGSQDNTPRILERLSANHHLFHYAALGQDSLLGQAGNALVVDCRNADWPECMKQIKEFLADGKRSAAQ